MNREKLIATIKASQGREVPTLIVKLADYKVSDDIPFFIDLLNNDDSLIRGAAALALAKVGGQEATNALLDATVEPDVLTRAIIARAIGQLKDNDLVPILEKIVEQDEELQVAEAAATGLAEIGTPEAIEARKKWFARAKETDYYAGL